MAITQEEFDRIMGKQSALERIIQQNQPTVKPYYPSTAEKLSSMAQSFLESTGMNRYKARDLTGKFIGNNNQIGLADVFPPTGIAKASEYAGQEFFAPAIQNAQQGNIGSAIGNAGLGIGATVLGVGKVPAPVKTAAKNVTKSVANNAKQAIGNIFEAIPSYEEAMNIAKTGGYLKRDSSGKYIGAPSWVNSPQDLNKMRGNVDQSIAYGSPSGGDWYDKARQSYSDVSGYDPLKMGSGTGSNEGNMASLFSRGGAVYSPQAAPPLETANFLTQYNNKVLLGKDVTPRMGAQAKNVAQAFKLDPNTGKYIFSPEKIKLGNKTGAYADSKDPTIPMDDLYRSANDIWQGRVFQYQNPDGTMFSRGFSPQEHGFLTGENLLAADRANQMGVKVGDTDLPMNTLRAQAGSWTGMRFAQAKADQADALANYNKLLSKHESNPKKYKKPSMPIMNTDEELMDYAKAGISETIPRHIANETYEYVTGENVGHLAGLNKLPESVRNEYTNKMAAAYGDRDPYYEAMQMYQLPQVKTMGEYLNSAGVVERNAGLSARPLVDLENSLLTSKTGSEIRGGAQLGSAGRAALDTTAEIRTMLNANEAGAYNKFTKANSSMKPTEKNSARIEGSENELSKAKSALEAQGLDVINVGNALHIANFNENLSAKQIQDAVKSALKNSKAKVTTQVGRLETGYVPVDWGKEGSGQVTSRLVDIINNSPIQNLGQRLDTSRLPSILLNQNEIDRTTAAALKLKEREDLYKLRGLLADPRIGFKGLPQYVQKYGTTGLPAVAGFSLLPPDEQR